MLTTEPGEFQDKRESYQGMRFYRGAEWRTRLGTEGKNTLEVVNVKGLENSVVEEPWLVRMSSFSLTLMKTQCLGGNGQIQHGLTPELS